MDAEYLARFRERTMGAILLMGSRTYASLPGPLPGRHIVVLTRRTDAVAGVETVSSIHNAVWLARTKDRPLYVAGGEQVYQQMMPHADRIELTEIHDLRPADTLFPPIPDSFRETRRQQHPATAGHPAFDFVTFSRETRAD